MKHWLKQIGIQFGVTFTALALLLTLGGPLLEHAPQPVREAVLRIGFTGEAYAINPDYQVDGTADSVQVQQALNALPSTGGRLILYAGNWDFDATVSRAINNVTIEGDGKGTYLANNGATALFSAGAQTGWIFKDFRTDAGYLTLANDTRVDNVWNVNVLVTPSGASSYVVAASDATASEKAGANWIADGTADQTEINAAIDALTTGGTVTLTSGTFTITAAIDMADGVDSVWLRGQGQSTILETASDIDTIDATPAAQTNHVRISDMQIVNTGGIKASKTSIRATNLWNFTISGIYLENQYDGLVIDGSNAGQIFDIRGQYYTRSGLYINNAVAVNIKNVVMGNTPATNSTYGLYVTGNTSGLQVFDAEFTYSGNGIQLLSAAGNIMEWLFFDSVMGDNCNGWGWNINANSGVLVGVTAVNCWAGTNAAGGVVIVDGSGIRFIGLKAVSNGGMGVYLLGGTNNAIDNSDIIANATAGAQAGILVGAAVSSFQLSGNRVGNIWGVGGGLQNYGITVSAGASDNYTIIGNNVLGNNTAGVSDGGSGTTKRVSNNIGYVTENAGTGTITGTSLVVTHGLSVTPTLAKIKIVGLEDPSTSVGTIWVSTATATQFTVNVETDPGASDWDFGWSYAE